MKILIVDDVDANLYLLRVLLTNAGYEIAEAINGQAALAVMETTDVDLIISDILMPVMDGFELCKIWKSDERLKSIPFIFYTATYTEEKDRKFSLDLGADLFLVKPMESYNLLREIEKVLQENEVVSDSEQVSGDEAAMDDASYYEEYSSRLVKKLEAKLLQLEQKNRELVRRDANLQQLNETLNFQLSKVQLAEEALREHEKELLSIVDSMAEGVLTTDTNGTIFEFNPSAERILGYARNEIVGQSINILIPEAKRHKHDGLMQRFVSSEKETLIGRDMRILTKNGEEVPIRLSVSRLPQGDLKHQLFICSFLDVTKEKQQEEAIAHSRKMEAIGNLSGGIAHDYNNMLGIIIGYGEILLEDIHEQKLRDYVELILHAAERGVSLSRKLLSMSKDRSASKEVVRVNDVMRDNMDMLKKVLMAKITLELNLSDEVPLVLIDKNDFEDCVLNMCINSMHAIAGSGRIGISTNSVKLEAGNKQSMDSGSYLHLMIEDNGCGMSEEVMQKIFEPFYTTKGEQGTGLGLSQVYGFVERAGGCLEVESKEGVGTRFDFYLPEFKGLEQEVESDQYKSRKIIEAGRSVMVVDDEPVLSKLVEIYLNEAGCDVVLARDAEECLKKLEQLDVDLVLSDVIMPGMDGFELADQLKVKYPETNVILMSGYNDKDREYQLKKPFTRNELLEIVNKTLQ